MDGKDNGGNLSLLDVGHFETSLIISKKGINVGAIASMWSPSVELDCVLFTITYSAEVGSFGFGGKADATGVKFGSSIGLGGFIEIEWSK